MKNIAASLITAFALIAGAPALAQMPAAPAAPTAPAVAQTPSDPAVAQAVKELLETMKYREMMGNAFKQMTKTMPAMFRQMSSAMISKNTKLSPEQQKAALARAEKAMPEVMAALDELINDPTLIDEMSAAIVPLYARYFTVDEIHQMAMFYKSGVGAKMLAVMPQLMGESMQMGQQIMMPRINRMVEKITLESSK